MLGYVRIDKGELKVREYEIYTGYYCGVCKSIGARYGQLPRMTLSYDAAFLAVLLASFDESPDMPEPEHCIGHHIKKKTVIRNRAVDFAADIMLILAWYKLADDIRDEGSMSARAAMTAFRRLHMKLYSQYPGLCDSIGKDLAKLAGLEAAGCSDLDMVSDLFAGIMQTIFISGLHHLYGSRFDQDPREEEDSMSDDRTDPAPLLSIDSFDEKPLALAESLASAGYHLGKWIYLIDAADDISENTESGAYNPLLNRFGFDSDTETVSDFKDRIRDDLSRNLYSCLAALGRYLDLPDIRKNRGIIENIIYLGLNRKTEEILKGDMNESI